MAYWIRKAFNHVLVIPDLYGKPVEYSPAQLIDRFTLAQIAQMRRELPIIA